ncbi:MAG: hypothetical protein WBZ36_06120 [Candidatus Nitrosopolaris sp.]
MKPYEDLNNRHELSVNDFYTNVCTNIRTTDEISFKLLGLVSFTSGIGMIGISAIADKASLNPVIISLVSFFAGIITITLYLWEKRNIQLCDHYIECAQIIERSYGQFYFARPEPEKWPRLQTKYTIKEDTCMHCQKKR